MPAIAIVTGSNTGIGRAAVFALAEKGFRVYATCRTPAKAQDLVDEAVRRRLQIQVVALDITDVAQCRQVVETIVAAEARIDVLVNNAGIGMMGAVEEVPMDKVHQQFATNVFGMLQLTQLVLPVMRKQRQGRIINISSVAGEMSVPGMGIYCASKFALEALSDALRIEVSGFGIHVSVVQPGPIETNFETASWGTPEDRPYDTEGPYAHVYQMIESSRRDFKRFSRPAQAVADVIAKAATARRPQSRYTVTLTAALTPLARKWLPDRLMDSMQIAMLRRFMPKT